ncbi:serine/threonine-protein kinase M1 [Podila verticillata]|nr:serine/threonine-protein kinase M1 [Podila verticillata]
MMELASEASAKHAFALSDQGPTHAPDPKQRLEWVVFTSVAPILAIASFSTIREDFVLGTLQATYATLNSSEEDPHIPHTSKPSRATEFGQAVVGTIQEIIMHLQQDLPYPNDCQIHMSSFKVTYDHDPVWMSFRFTSPTDAVNVLCGLITLLCPSHDEAGWPINRIDSDLKLALLLSVISIFDLVQERQSLSSVGTAQIDQMYQACVHCLLEVVPRLNSIQSQLLANLGLRVATALRHHVSTMQERCQEWGRSSNRNQIRIKQEGEPHRDSVEISIKEQRREMTAVDRLEALFVKSLITILERLVSLTSGSMELDAIDTLVSSLLYSEALHTMGVDENGMGIQIAAIRVATLSIQAGVFPHSLELIDHILLHYIHLESGCLVRFISCCLKFWQKHGNRDHRIGEDFDDTETLPTLSLESIKGDSPSIKRSFDDVDDKGGPSDLGKRTRRERDALNLNPSPSVETTISSSIIPNSQFSQRLSHLLPIPKSTTIHNPSEQLLALLKRYVNIPPIHHAASQGSRGVQPPLSTDDLLSILVLVQVWLEVGPRTLDETGDICQFETLMESIFRSYLFWTLSPGMQNLSLNLQYLQCSYPLVLDLIALLAQLDLKTPLIELLVCVTSGPWFPNLSKPELWTPGETMELDGDGTHQLVGLIQAITEGTEIHARLAASPGTLLEPCVGFQGEKLILDALKPTSESILHKRENDTTKTVAIDCLAVMTTHCPDMQATVKDAVGLTLLLPNDTTLMKTLALRMGTMFCGLSNDGQHLGPQCIFDIQKQRLARIALLNGLSRVFCHLSLDTVDLSTLEFGKFVLGQLTDKSADARNTAGYIVERMAIKVKSEIAVSPLGRTSMDKHLVKIGETIMNGLDMSIKKVRLFMPMLSLCRRLMQHLSEDHPTYLQLLEELIVDLSAERSEWRCTAVFLMLSLLAENKGHTPYRLLQPKMELVCTSVLDKFSNGHEKWLQSLYDWTNMSKDAFLKDNFTILIPQAVLVQQEGLLRSFGDLMKMPPGVVCIHHVDHVLATLFMEENPETFGESMSFLLKIVVQVDASDAKPKVLGLPTLTTLSIQALLCQLSIELGHEKPERRERAMEVIKMVDGYAWENEVSEQPRNNVPERRSLSTFLCLHILGIMSDINNAIKDSNRAITLTAKARHLRSLEGLVTLLQPIPNSVMPQIFSPLTTALDILGLRRVSLQVLNKIIHAVEPSQLENLLPIVVHTLAKVYPKSNKKDQADELSILRSLIVVRQKHLAAELPNVGALPDLPEFQEVNLIVATSKMSLLVEEQIQRLLNRSANENPELAEQALVELRDFLVTNERQLLDLASQKGAGLDKIIVPIIQALLDGIGRYRGLDAPVPRRCVECLGVVGAIDPALVSLKRKQPTSPLASNFADTEEAKAFVCDFIEHQLVGPARSVGDFNSESQWAFALQSLLSFCGISKDVLVEPSESTQASRQLFSQRASLYSQTSSSQSSSQSVVRKGRPLSPRDRWNLFPRHVQELLELFIGAKYNKNSSSADTVYPRPHYNHAKTFKEWLTRWTRQLISQVSGDNAVKIFQSCKHVIAYDTNICLYILPHLVLNVLRDGSATEQQDIIDEMAAVLADGQQDDATFSNNSRSERYQLGCQAVFALFDHVSKWIHMRKNATSKPVAPRAMANASQAATRQSQDPALAAMQTHLTSISHGIIAMASLRCKAFARALFHSEQQIRDARQDPRVKPEALQELYEKLQEIYVHMEDPDGMEGLSSKITSGAQAQSLRQCESAGRWNEAHSYYESWLRTQPNNLDPHLGVYKCLDNLGQYDTLLSTVAGDISFKPDWEEVLSECRVGAAWKLQNWGVLEDALARPIVQSFETRLGQLLLDIRGNGADFTRHLEEARSSLIAPLAAASMESYSRSYDQVVQLHLLHELEVAHKSWNACSRLEQAGQYAAYINLLQDMETQLDQRLHIMAPSFKVREQVQRLRRIAFYDIRIPAIELDGDTTFLLDECGKLWLQSARAARHSGNEQVSFSALLKAEEHGNRPALIERIKWGFRHNQERQALQSIDNALKKLVPSMTNMGGARGVANRVNVAGRARTTANALTRADDIDLRLRRVQDRLLDTGSDQFLRAKALLLRTQRMDQSNFVNPMEIIDGYREAIEECKEWEKGYYLLGQHLFKTYDASKRSSRIQRPKAPPIVPSYSYATRGFRLYGKALSLGPKYLYQILPRLLTYWLDMGVDVSKLDRATEPVPGATALVREFRNITDVMDKLCDTLPPYMFLSAFPQIISRMCHKNPDAFGVLQRIISAVVVAFPDQAIWQMVSVSKSIVPERKRVCNSILKNIGAIPTLGGAIFDQIKEALDLCDQLILLCMATVPDKVPKLSMERTFPKITRMLRMPSNVTIPFHLSLWPQMPESSRTMASHQSFPKELPKIECFLDEIEVMSSLQRPRKVTADDLRKDAKVMEFNTLVNMLLRKNRDAHRRNLYIRTYAVVPLNEECGLIEWVHNTVPFRHIIQKQCKMNSMSIPTTPEIRRILDSEDHVRMFTRDLLPKCPTIFYRWFKEISPEPTEWYATRQRYVRTTAVMSMVGHIMGLGDRHGENLLFDERNGDIVHVDFNCLFEQGKTFPKPEKVPFRLTHNMVDAMGLSGYEGVYRIVCEITLRVFRENFESLTSVLEGFLHDPLVEWSKNKKRQQPQDNAPPPPATTMGEEDQAQHDKAGAIYMQIKRKLAGNEVSSGYVLSVEGQVQELIHNATNPENLAKMYIGWNAFL